ncbi:hypothetical protein [Sneathiella chinensis]|uniref:SPOR domain-containing protein n=1 Tax=Sneathiella chinensis TaxID=349750 RepID=A0ABQ5U908_9PROT|nr:hypothetical protein [Sneathiella chinensis]GLQ06971.1 hypothetical protein GCM10007924_21920 [Sneathiella chinensis]
MTIQAVSSSDIYVVQTQFDGAWRSFRKYVGQDKAVDLAEELAREWGQRRVRILVGRYDPETQRRRYTAFSSEMIEHFGGRGRKAPWANRLARPFAGRKAMLGTSVAGGALLLAALLVGGLAFSPLSQADNSGQGAPAQAAPEKGEAEGVSPLEARFSELTRRSYSRPIRLPHVPVRLQGDWSRNCLSGIQEYQIKQDTLVRFEGALALDAPLSSVLQSGQVYGLLTGGGELRVFEMVGVDRLKAVGVVTASGLFTPAADGPELHRCL